MTSPMFESALRSLPLRHCGKVRDIYDIDATRMLIVTTDRISAFDVVLPTPVPGKGVVLTRLSRFWFEHTRDIVPNQLLATPLADVVPDPEERAPLEGRALVVRKLEALPFEAVVRGYLVGSGWKDYQRTGSVCGIALPAGLKQAERLPQPLFTPSTKAPLGAHDENVSFETMAAGVGEATAERVRELSLALYRFAAEHARARGIIIADTKFEFGMDDNNRIYLIDEALTPDSSRFWPADQYLPGANPPSFDKQYVRDYLETLAWDKRAPGPVLPPDIVARTAEKYREALRRLAE